MELHVGRVNIGEFVRGLAASVEPMAQKKNIGISCELSSSLPETYLDREKVERVILNLVFNSLKFTEAGGKVKIGVRLQEQLEARLEANDESPASSQFLEFRIEDTGIGIASDYLPKIFERFSQADTSSTRKHEGTGIGMALVKEFVELHGGRIWVESELRHGTTVFFTLPHLTSVPPAAKTDQRTERVEVGEKKRDTDWTKALHERALYEEERTDTRVFEAPLTQLGVRERTILLVEDNVDMVNFLSFQLQDTYNLVKAKNGVEGVEAAKLYKPDLIISDVMMPIKDGYQLCREVKEDPKTQHVPVILLTAKTDLSMKVEGFEYGADDYLTKPFSSEELQARIRSLLKSREMEGEIQKRNEDLEKTLKELKEAQMQLVQSAKMASIGQLAAGIAHEMNNPLTFVSSSLFSVDRLLQKLREGLIHGDEFLKGSWPLLERVTTGVKRTQSVIDDLMNFARKDVEGLKEEDLNQGIRSVFALLKNRVAGDPHTHSGKDGESSSEADFTEKKSMDSYQTQTGMGVGVKLHLELGEIPKVECVLGQINQVIMNLVLNALDALGESGEIWVRTVSKEGEVQIRIRDNGKGIPREVQGRIFEPFFTTKDVGKGTGLGLSISHKIVENHHGSIEFSSEFSNEVERGTEFVVRLPVKQPVCHPVG
ncbi:MAG: response regulator [Chlamydiae bacterium]|nr:response regulator [Chlamydiota bacterium]